ncbi:hypothetical protein S40285_10786 [Stachybotrys chlorohalonatus IBT 40285]|uniref:Uncharacterized protein n=1 Tax=Stachybotrys chlorohalonatus (strain IBT 40285) TaxID=1283841 RepID=A0A084QWI9_STAC4|nr:hypothetical protein S40285_10786 [Stachybotrys chlorohalonata IBT 40285]
MLGAALALLAAMGPISVSGHTERGLVTARQEEGRIMQIPEYIYAGEETTWKLDLSRSNLSLSKYQKLEIHFAARPRDFEIDGAYLADNYFPAAAFPHGSRIWAYMQYYEDVEDRWGTWAGIDSHFTVLNSNASWSAYEKAWGWGVLGIGLPCEAVPCARTCVIRHYDAEVDRQTHQRRQDYARCVEEECGVLQSPGQILGGQCISSNSRAPPREEPTDDTPLGDDGGSGGPRTITGSLSWLYVWMVISWTGFCLVA